MSLDAALLQPEPGPGKFEHPDWTAKREPRASVRLDRLETLWINTGTLCNITCRNCYIESSPSNDRLVYITAAEAAAYFDEIAAQGLGTREIGFTGGEPFMNPQHPRHGARCAGARLRGAGAEQRHAADAAAQDEAGAARSRTRFGATPDASASASTTTRKALHETERGARSWAEHARRARLARAQRLQGGDRRAAPAGTRARRTRGGLCRGSSRSTAGRSMPPIRPSWCCCRRWTASTTCRRSPPAAGPS